MTKLEQALLNEIEQVLLAQERGLGTTAVRTRLFDIQRRGCFSETIVCMAARAINIEVGRE